mgnify:CR=1 FL=1
MLPGGMSGWQVVEYGTQVQDLGLFQVRVVTDVVTVEVDMVYLGVASKFTLPYERAQVGLTELVAAAGSPSPVLYIVLPQSCHHVLVQFRIRVLEHQREGVIAAAVRGKVGAVFFGI